jgi:hypothetical protein
MAKTVATLFGTEAGNFPRLTGVGTHQDAGIQGFRAAYVVREPDSDVVHPNGPRSATPEGAPRESGRKLDGTDSDKRATSPQMA